MKLTLTAVASTLFALSLSAHAQDMPGMKMDGMEGMQMKQETKQAPVANADGTITVSYTHLTLPTNREV